MSLETVAEDIRDEAREEAATIRERAEAEAESIRDGAERDAEEILDRAEREAEREVAREREQRLSSAKLEAKQSRLAARRDVLGEVRESVEDAVASLSSEEREELTRELVAVAAEEFAEADSVQVYASADDADLVESILDEYDGWTLAGEYDCLGGVVVESEASRVRVNNSFDSVLEDVWEDELKDVSTRLFEQEQ